MRTLKKFFYFSVSGGVGYIVNALVLYVASIFIQTEWVIWFVATVSAIVTVFMLNSLLTFRSKTVDAVVSYKKRFFIFLLSSLGALAIQVVIGTLFVGIYGEQYRQIILPIVIIFVVAPYNWCMYNSVIWKK